MKGKDRREEREIFCIKIMDREANEERPYILGRIVAYPMFREPIGKLLQVIFCKVF
jgi:hypothetical protein